MISFPEITSAFYRDAASILILCLGSIVSMLQTINKKFSSETAVFYTTFVSFSLALVLSIIPAVSQQHLNGSYLSDHLARYACICILSIALIIILQVKDTFLSKRFFRGEIACIFQMVVLGMLVFVASRDLITVFVGLEISSIGLYVLIGYINPSRSSQEGSIKYFVLGSVAAAFLLYGFSLLYAASGSLDLKIIIESLVKSSDNYWKEIGVVFILCGLSFKLALAPFHIWAPDAYEASPTALTGFMATAVKIAVLVFIMRISAMGLQLIGEQWLFILMSLAAVSMIFGNILALVQSSIKRILAYSSIAHSGYMAIAICVLSNSSAFPYQAIMFYLIAYSLTSLLAFGVLIWLESEKIQNIHLDDITGLVRSHPWAALALSVAMFSFAGIPPTAGFLAKFFIFNVALEAHFYSLVLIGVLGSLISLFYYLRIIVCMYMSQPTEDMLSLRPIKAFMTTVILSTTLFAVLLLGTYLPSMMMKSIKPAAQSLIIKR